MRVLEFILSDEIFGTKKMEIKLFLLINFPFIIIFSIRIDLVFSFKSVERKPPDEKKKFHHQMR